MRQLRERMGTRDLNGPFHASEIFRCLRRTIRNRETPEDDSMESLLMFAIGFAMQEYFLGDEPDGIPVDGIVFSADKIVDGRIFEFKTTRRSYERWPRIYDDKGKYKLDKSEGKLVFSPDLSWIVRTQAYSAANGIKTADVVVFFLYSNEIHDWTIEFTDEELTDIREEGVMRLNVLNRWHTGLSYPGVHTRIEDKECDYCPFKDECMPELLKDGWTDDR